jgi:ABC-2 type transport system ATP-binding protein
LSHGLRRRVGLAQAILHRPPLLLLDDPLAGLAPDEAAVMRHLIRRLAHRSTVLLATPVPEEVEALCDRVLILLQGVVRADLRLAQLHATAGAILVLDAPVREAANCLLAMPGVRSIAAIVSDCGYPAYRVVGDDPHNLCPAIFALANANGWPLRELRPDHNTLRGALTTLGDLHTEHEPAIIHTT